MLPESPDDTVDAGTAHWELATRFANEDLREPILKDNALDGDLLREHLDKNRLGEWYREAQRAARKAIDAHRQQQDEAYEQLMLSHEDAEDDDVAYDEGPSALAAPAEDMETAEDAGSDTFEADIESVADQDQDVEMGEA